MNQLFKVVFSQHDELHEIYAHSVSESTMMHFIEVEALAFAATSSEANPSEQQLKGAKRLRETYANVQRIYIPIHAVLRIEEVAQIGSAQVHPIKPIASQENAARLLDPTWSED